MDRFTVGGEVPRNRLVWAVMAFALFLGVAVIWTVASPQKAEAGSMEPTAPEEVYALTRNDVLLQFNGNNPNDVERTPITGLRGNESLVGIDFRPSGEDATQGLLYGVGTKSNIYTIDVESGEATRVSQLREEGADSKLALSGRDFGVDFNPTVDLLRIVSDSDQNLRVDVDTGGTTVDGTLDYVDGDENADANPRVSAVAYRNSQPTADDGGGTTALFDLDVGLDILAQQTNANAGELATIGDLGPNIKLNNGFDIVTIGPSPEGDQAFAALRRKEVKASGFFSVDLESGDVSSMGRIDGPRTKVEGLAIPIGGGIGT